MDIRIVRQTTEEGDEVDGTVFEPGTPAITLIIPARNAVASRLKAMNAIAVTMTRSDALTFAQALLSECSK